MATSSSTPSTTGHGPHSAPHGGNPFTPGFGLTPMILAGRDVAIEEFTAALAGNVPEARAILISGARGSGKTVLRFDLVVSNHLLHHLSEEELRGVLEDSRALARRACVHSDIRRGRLAYALFSLATWPLFPRTFIREDGLTSIRRSYLPSELRGRLPSPWRVETQRPFRVLATLAAGAPPRR